MSRQNKHKPCLTCGGTGQIRFFQGESRFLLTDEECPDCAGLGYLLHEPEGLRDQGNSPSAPEGSGPSGEPEESA